MGKIGGAGVSDTKKNDMRSIQHRKHWVQLRKLMKGCLSLSAVQITWREICQDWSTKRGSWREVFRPIVDSKDLVSSESAKLREAIKKKVV